MWTTADKFLRDVVEPEDYGDIIPFTVLRRTECILADTKPALLEFLASTKLSGNARHSDPAQVPELHFYNSSTLDLTKIASTDDKVLESLKVYVASFSVRSVTSGPTSRSSSGRRRWPTQARCGASSSTSPRWTCTRTG